MRFTDDQIMTGVREAIADALKVNLDKVRQESVLTDELDAASLDFVDIMFRLETLFGVTFYPGNPLDRLTTHFGDDTLARGGSLTGLGAEVVRARMPEIDGSRVTSGMLLGNVQSLYTTSTWVRAVTELLAVQPEACPSCGSPRLDAPRPSVLACAECGEEIACTTQGDILLDWATRHFPEQGHGAS